MPSVAPDSAVVACLVAFVALSFVDGIVIHLWRERLFRRVEARLEHALHTARAALFPVILVAFFGGKAGSLGVAALVVDQLVEVADMAVERRSRAFSGGLRSSEYVLHGALITTRAAAVAFALVAGPPSARLSWVVDFLVPGAILTALLHVALMAPRLSRRPA
ncbi:MAG: hypothetical protein R3B06_32745 [Kofleriaceae bacterium]